MTFILADRVKETSTTTGTGTYTLAGAVSNFLAFSARMANNDTCYYHAIDSGGSGWEVGIGTWATGGTLARTTILASSNSDAAVNWGAGTRNISIGLPAEKYKKGVGLYDLSAGVPAYSSFTGVNAGSVTVTESAGKAIHIAGNGGTDNTKNILFYKAAPSTPYTITALLIPRPFIQNASVVSAVMLGFHDGTKFHYLKFRSDVSSGSQWPKLTVQKWSNYNTFVANDSDIAVWPLGQVFLQISDDGSNVAFRYSTDSVDFVDLYSIAKSSGYLGSSGYTNVCFGFLDANPGGTPVAAVTLRLWDTAARVFP